jgi:hypothetical protein
VPFAIEELGGVVVIDFSVAAVTVTAAAADTPPRVAVIVALPTPIALTRPSLLTVVIAFEDEVQIAKAVRSWVVPSEKLPVAVTCTVVPLAIEEPGGVTVIDVSVAAVTVTVVAPDTPP